MTQEQNSENSYILEGLLQEYHSIWLVDKNDLTFTLYRAGETTGAKKAFEIAFKLKTYDKILEAYVQNVVAERDRERVRKDADVKNILKQIKKKGIFTINYLRFNNEGQEVYQQMAFADSKTDKFIIAFKDINESLKNDIEGIAKEERLRQYQSDEETLELIHESLGSALWEIEFDEHCKISKVRWSNPFRKMLGFENEIDFPNIFESTTDLIYGESHDKFLNAFWDSVNDFSGKTIFDENFQLYTKNIGLKWFRGAGRISRRSDGTPKRFVGLFIDIQEEVENSLKIENQLKIVNALCRGYLNVFKINPKERSATIIKLDGYVTPGLHKDSTEKYPYDAFVQKYIREWVLPEDQDMMLHAMDLKVVQEKLNLDSEYDSSYRVKIDDEIHFYQFKYIRLESDDNSEIIAGFKNIDALVIAAKEKEELIALAETDLMTKLYNKVSGERKIIQALNEKKNGLFCIMDVDHFKFYNDAYGHSVGDKVIREVARSISDCFRGEDIKFRLGGDEFSIFAFEITDKTLAETILQRFFDRIDRIIIPELVENCISISLGASIITENSSRDFETIYKQTDECVYLSKKFQGNKMTFVDELLNNQNAKENNFYR